MQHWVYILGGGARVPAMSGPRDGLRSVHYSVLRCAFMAIDPDAIRRRSIALFFSFACFLGPLNNLSALSDDDDGAEDLSIAELCSRRATNQVLCSHQSRTGSLAFFDGRSTY